jgi:hypothetical protein
MLAVELVDMQLNYQGEEIMLQGLICPKVSWQGQKKGRKPSSKY